MAEERVCNLVRLACMEVSPFKLNFPENSKLRIQERGHILEVLYYCVVPLSAEDDFDPKASETEKQLLPELTIILRAFKSVRRAASSSNVGPVRPLTLAVERVYNRRAVQIVMQLPFQFLRALGNLPVLHVLKGPFRVLRKSYSTVRKDSPLRTLTRDELDVPSVADLYYEGVKFLPTEGGLATIHFDRRTATLHLPKLVLDANAEVILRNLVAFEAAAAPGAMIFARYTDFMNGIIDTEEDVRLLRSCGIIFNHMESDAKPASLWNGMGRRVKLTRVKYLDQVIADLNQHYRSRWTVGVQEYMKKYIFRAWKFLAVVCAAILLLLICFEDLCSALFCKKWFNDDFLDEQN